jgi:flagellar protein FlaF
MGFSVSGSAAVLFIAAFVSVGILYSAAFNGYERVQDADDAHGEQVLERRNTAVSIVSETYNGSAGTMTVNVSNDGATTLSVSETDLLVDGEYRAPDSYISSSVAGNNSTDVWAPGETLTLKVNASETDAPDRVKIVTGPGVTATSEVVQP